MQMIPSAEAIGQGDCEASKTTGARTFVTRVAFTLSIGVEKGPPIGMEKGPLLIIGSGSSPESIGGTRA